MDTTNGLQRFLDAQNQVYLKALSEIKNGEKSTHWIWYLFPQIKGLGKSETAKFYGLDTIEEATAYLAHPVLGRHLIEISEALLDVQEKTATQILGTPDDLKVRSCMTLFANIKDTDPIFEKVLLRYYNGSQDELTLQLLLKNKLTS